ncbi:MULTISPECIES: solute:sodium symporter family transporter [unclassified Gemella]|uniref:solute:sodium symporter family transporter n=1 Tax=unclassified Gemella TaxID=2624949 RepID=UPI001C04BFD8|nr:MULTISPECIES: solute:sodium symporter family transporter [unclassified Gemella]MBU0278247.1 solute:sodium symporter family transporter [Gemella sp. zg-1178]QWQ38798.1 solute:sodium symporter family transporter [Gemella sp. zg-570]
MGLFSIISFLVIIIFVALYAYNRSKSTVDSTNEEGYFLGGRSLTSFAIASTIIMTNLSTEQIVGQNGQSFKVGMEVMAWEVTAAITLVVLALVFLPRYFKYGINTISDFIEVRYDTMTKRVVSVLFMFTYIVSFLPVVLYSGSLVFNKIFRVDQILGISSGASVVVISSFIGAVGILYLLLGGMSLGAYSDTIYGVGLIVGGLAIPVIGLIILGDGSFLAGIEHIVQNSPEKLNSIGAIDSEIVPWPTLFFGMLFNNLFFWCSNQMIVQKALAAKNLKEAQKGALTVGFFKIFGALFLVFPGILAFNMVGDKVTNPDDAYPTLIVHILPQWALGIFGAVIFGAILSSFVGSLSSTVTLFTLDIYKPIFGENKDTRQITRIGRLVTLAIGVLTTIIAPLIALFPQGLYAVVQEFNGIYNMPLLVLILAGFFAKRVSASGAKWTFFIHILLYGLSKVYLSNIHFLYVLSVLFFLDLIILLTFSKYGRTEEFDFNTYSSELDLTPWKNRYLVSTVVVVTVVATYLLFSPLGLAK